MTILVTGVAGFIGYHLAYRLLKQGSTVIGVDNLNNYYDPLLKRARLNQLRNLSSSSGSNFVFSDIDISDAASVHALFQKHTPEKVVNLSAQAGVRYSIQNPQAYIQANLLGFSNILEASKQVCVSNFLFASSSSVYGGNTLMPFSESHNVDHPVSLYAATKKSNELMAHSYSHLFGLPSIGLRFFTVYGPWGRPDMALFIFTRSILANEPINVYNHGHMVRDFTYIDDVIQSLILLLDKPPTPFANFNPLDPDPSMSWAPYRIVNVGNSNPRPLLDYIHILEDKLGRTAQKQLLPLQPGDVPSTSSDTSKLTEWIGYTPSTSLETGISKFVDWYLSFYHS